MADNVAITAGSGTTIGTDDVGGVQIQRAKVTWGPDGTANDADVATGKPLPVQVRSATGLIPLGEPTDAKSTATDTTSVSAISVLKQISASVQAPPSQAVTNAGTFVTQIDGAALTALQLIDDPVATLGTTTYTEASTKGMIAGAVRRDANTSLVDTTNEVAPLQVNATGELKVAQIQALPAGTNAIGKLAANSGVDIGDVDVTSVPTDPFGVNADAASATGSISAKLRFIAATGIPITGTVTVGSHAVTVASGGVASGAIASGAVASGAVASGAFASGSIASGAMVDVGAIADAAVTAGATGSLSAKLRSISRDIVANIVLAAGSAIIGKVGIDQTTPGTTDSVSVKSQGYSASVTLTRTADTNAYTANDILGSATGSTAALTFTSMGPSAGKIMITSVALEIDATAIISGETSYRLYLYNITPPSALGDNAAFDLPSGDRASFLGYVDLGTPVDLGSTLYVETNGVSKQLLLSGTSLFGYLVTVGAYTPTSARVHKITLHAVAV